MSYLKHITQIYPQRKIDETITLIHQQNAD